MATSLYGTVKKVGSSQFMFDKVYDSRTAMELAMTNDGIYHGRYVLVSYGDKFGTNNANANTDLIIPETPVAGNDNITPANIQYSVNLNQTWISNYNRDLNKYQNTYDKTVWQKVFEGTTAKYIMVASLIARAPALTINEDGCAFKLRNAQTGETAKTYHIKGEVNPRIKVADYPNPKWHETYSNELIYHLDMPMPLQLDLATTPNYLKDGFKPRIRTVTTTAAREANLNNDNNDIYWNYIKNTNGNNDEITGAEFYFNLPAIGQCIHDIYDALYGIKKDSSNLETLRYANPNDFNTALDQTADRGIIGVLKDLQLSNNTYYFHGDWTATATEFGHIENKPILITGVTIGENTHKLVFETNVAVS